MTDTPAPVAQPLSAREVIEAKLQHERGLPPLMTSSGYQAGLEFALRALADAARSVPSDRPASGLTDPDNAALREALERLTERLTVVKAGTDNSERQEAYDNALRLVRLEQRALAAAPASPSGSSPGAAGLDWRVEIANAAEWIGWDVSYCYWCGGVNTHEDGCVWVAARLASPADPHKPEPAAPATPKEA